MKTRKQAYGHSNIVGRHATDRELYVIARLLNVSIDTLFASDDV